ncbi:hypothetical protein RI367_001646 [Sorochytrium milnesiophthora]
MADTRDTETEPLATTTFANVLAALETRGRTHPPIVAVPPSATIRECLHTLASNNVLSVPVKARLHSAAADRQSMYSSILSVFDIIGFVVEQLRKEGLSATDAPPLTAGDKDGIDRAMDRVLAQRVELAATLDDQRESYRVWERDVDDTLRQTIHAFATGTHRALLTSVSTLSPAPPRMFTQSDLVRYVQAFPESVAGIPDLQLDRPLSDHRKIFALKPSGSDGQSSPISVPSTVTALHAFAVMYQHSVLALPVVNAQGQIVSVISNSHLRGLLHSTLRSLRLPVLDFLKACTKAKDGRVPPPVTCTLATPVRQVIDMLVAGSQHRVWIVEEGAAESQPGCCPTPIGVATLSDVIRLFDTA